MEKIEIINFKDNYFFQLLELLNNNFKNIEIWNEEKLNSFLNSLDTNKDTFLLGLYNNSLIGCCSVKKMPYTNKYKISNLAINFEFEKEGILYYLLEKAEEFIKDKKINHFLIVTPLKKFLPSLEYMGYKITRRIIRIEWNFNLMSYVTAPKKVKNLVIRKIKKFEYKEIAKLAVESLKPYWDWWIEEEGGEEILLKKYEDLFKNLNIDDIWYTAQLNQEYVGLAGITIFNNNFSRLNGVFVLPKFRRKGIGENLLFKILLEASKFSERLIVHTFSFPTVYSPSVNLYLKYGGKIKAEFFHLEKILN